jgi:Uma2 family endonuclease
MPISAQTYRRVASEDPDGRWELDRGHLREKPSMSYRHNRVTVHLGGQLLQQLDPDEHEVRINLGHVNRIDETYYIPDVFVLPVSAIGPDHDRPDILEIYDQPLPLVVEVWSPWTGTYDVNAKLPEYRRRGDLEIWRVHPFDRTLTVWRRRPDGGYVETVYDGGHVQPASLPGVTIDLDALWR